MKERAAADGFYTIRCPRCEDHPKIIGGYRGTPCEGFEVGFWCQGCKLSIMVSWVKTCAGMVMKWSERKNT